MAGELYVTPVPKAPISSVALNPDIEENILDSYDLPTYHFRLYMMSDDAVRQKTFGPASREQRIVIAESGVTAMSIEDVTIESISSISRKAGIGTATEFRFMIQEPFGATLIDQISNASKILGVGNFARIPFFLELSFRGRVNEGRDQLGVENELRDLVWTWPILLTQMAIDVGSGGSTYTLQATVYADSAQTNQASDTQQPVSIEAKTVGEFFVAFQKQMSERAASKIETSNYLYADTYNFFIDQEIYDASIVPDNLADRQNRAEGFNESTGKMVFSFIPPISIDRIVENVLSLTTLFQKQIKSTEDPDAIGDDKKGEDATTQLLYRMITDTTLGYYDENRSDYQHNYRYLISPYEMTTVTTVSNNNSTQSSQQRIDTLRRKGRIKKLYNYIYTGLNDQVLDFDLTFNFNWYAALPLQAGVSTNPAAAESMATADADQRSASEVAADSINKTRSFLAKAAGFNPISFFEDQFNQFVDTNFSGVNQTTADISSNVDSVQAQVNDAQVAANTAIGSVTSTVQSGIPAIPETIGGLVLPPNPISNTISAINQITSFTRLPRVPTVNSNTSLSGGQAQRELREADPYLDDIILGEKGNLVLKTPIAETKSGDNNSDTGGLAQTPGRTLLSAMFEQARSPISGDLLDIDLVIKGDPYWLEPPPINRTDAPRSPFDRLLANRGVSADGGSVEPITNGTAQNFTVADSADAQTYIVFRSFTPLEFSATTGITPSAKTSNNALNGVYGVRSVTHEFSGGQFKQTLHANRDPMITLSEVDLDASITDIPAESDITSIFTQDQVNVSNAPGGASTTLTGAASIGTDAVETASALVRRPTAPSPLGSSGGNPPSVFFPGGN